ncbi:8584_t:CDS:2 [Scutellospora calospora]|uniref:8584_t:CDS:1 n=1 Tax=Scutellospora calospora TaxID=85575 RepID=A0ACA9KB10_9GLOM|nr:8584_t:CDS:2 [Scutellospora calospora]
MGKRKRSFRPPPTYETGNDKFDNQGGRISKISTWEDVEHDSEDDLVYAGRDQISLDPYEAHKHDESELSEEEEVFALETGIEDENKMNNLEEDGSIFDSTWGSRKENYYNADEISNLSDAREEEEEALKLQKKRISQMTEDDFLEIDGELLESKTIDRKPIDYADDFDLMSFDGEVLDKERKDLSRDGITKIIKPESPELIELLTEFKEKSSILWNTITPLLDKARQKNLIHDPAMKFISIKHQILVHYLINISFYLALKSSGTQNLREHPVIDVLVKFKMTLNKLERLECNIGAFIGSFVNKLEQADQADVSEVKINESKNEEQLMKQLKQIETEYHNNKNVNEDSIITEGAKRQINYQILKNKGLTPYRKKEQRNPRVKHRNRYEKAKKKIKSIKRVFSQQEGSYGGEKTGIKTGLSRSIKLG